MLSKNNIDLFIKVALGSLLIVFLRVELVFSDLLPTGGDMGAHIVPTKFFVSELFNNFFARRTSFFQLASYWRGYGSTYCTY